MYLATITTLTALLAFAAATPSASGSAKVLCRPPCGEQQVCVPGTTKDSPRIGVCVTPSGTCGGLIGRGCEGTYEKCIDDPRDDCDPAKGGSDCIGVCVPV